MSIRTGSTPCNRVRSAQFHALVCLFHRLGDPVAPETSGRGEYRGPESIAEAHADDHQMIRWSIEENEEVRGRQRRRRRAVVDEVPCRKCIRKNCVEKQLENLCDHLHTASKLLIMYALMRICCPQ